MFRLALLLAAAVVARGDDALESLTFASYLKQHKLSFPEAEMPMREKLFNAELARVIAHNKGNKGWVEGKRVFSSLLLSFVHGTQVMEWILPHNRNQDYIALERKYIYVVFKRDVGERNSTRRIKTVIFFNFLIAVALLGKIFFFSSFNPFAGHFYKFPKCHH